VPCGPFLRSHSPSLPGPACPTGRCKTRDAGIRPKLQGRRTRGRLLVQGPEVHGVQGLVNRVMASIARPKPRRCDRPFSADPRSAARRCSKGHPLRMADGPPRRPQPPSKGSELGDLPIKSVWGAMVYLHYVAHVHNAVRCRSMWFHVDGNRSVLLIVFKNGMTLDARHRHWHQEMLNIKPSRAG